MNPTDTLTHVDRDTNQQIRYCSPNAKTKSFAVVESSGEIHCLDSTGNKKAADLVLKTGKKPRFGVSVTGELNRNTIQVNSISIAR